MVAIADSGVAQYISVFCAVPTQQLLRAPLLLLLPPLPSSFFFFRSEQRIFHCCNSANILVLEEVLDAVCVHAYSLLEGNSHARTGRVKANAIHIEGIWAGIPRRRYSHRVECRVACVGRGVHRTHPPLFRHHQLFVCVVTRGCDGGGAEKCAELWSFSASFRVFFQSLLNNINAATHFGGTQCTMYNVTVQYTTRHETTRRIYLPPLCINLSI